MIVNDPEFNLACNVKISKLFELFSFSCKIHLLKLWQDHIRSALSCEGLVWPWQPCYDYALFLVKIVVCFSVYLFTRQASLEETKLKRELWKWLDKLCRWNDAFLIFYEMPLTLSLKLLVDTIDTGAVKFTVNCFMFQML